MRYKHYDKKKKKTNRLVLMCLFSLTQTYLQELCGYNYNCSTVWTPQLLMNVVLMWKKWVKIHGETYAEKSLVRVLRYKIKNIKILVFFKRMELWKYLIYISHIYLFKVHCNGTMVMHYYIQIYIHFLYLAVSM